MKPEQFIREFGVEKAREVVEVVPEGATHYGLRQYCQWEGRILKTFTDDSWVSTAVFGGNLRFIEDDCLCIHDLNRLVESLDIIETVGYDRDGAEEIYEFSKDCEVIHYAGLEIRVTRLAQAIRDYESIYGGGDA